MTIDFLKRPSLLVAAPLVLLCACDGSDPRTGGFTGGVAGIVSGNYEARRATLERELDGKQTELAAAESEAAAAETGLRTATAKRDSARARARALEGELASIRRETDKITATTDAERSRVTALRADLGAKERERRALEAGPSGGLCSSEEDCSRKIADLERSVAGLRADLEALSTDSGL